MSNKLPVIDLEDTACVVQIVRDNEGKKYVEEEDYQEAVSRLQLIIKQLKEEREHIIEEAKKEVLQDVWNLWDRLSMIHSGDIIELAQKHGVKIEK